MSKTLYITDLDGTLMDPTPMVTEYTADVINTLVKKGMTFSYATARSNVSAGELTKNINVSIPVIIYNGALILESGTNRILNAVYFDKPSLEDIFSNLFAAGIYPIVYAMIDGVEKFSFAEKYVTPEEQAFLDTRHDSRKNPVEKPDDLRKGNPFYFSCISTEEKLLPLYEKFHNKYSCVYQKDIYSGAQWLEIMPKSVSKASAIVHLKNMLGCDRIVSFGDGINDIPMFEISDECHAVENAVPELKKIASSVIGPNTDDGVAKWLLKNAEI